MHDPREHSPARTLVQALVRAVVASHETCRSFVNLMWIFLVL